MHESVLVLDFGSQYTQLIARRIRELGVYSIIKPCTAKPDTIDLASVKAIILSGGPASVLSSDAPQFSEKWLESGKPILGVCYGMQLLAHLFGGRLGQGERREYGSATVEILEPKSIFAGFDKTEKTPVWMSHGDHVDELPPGFHLLARSESVPYAAMANPDRGIYATQFHIEVVHTPRGRDVLSNFLFSIAGCSKEWSSSHIIDECVEKIKETVPPGAQVICGLSGGVDSTVAAVLVSKAIGERLHCIFVDNGLLRAHEGDEVVKMLGPTGYGLNIHRVNAGARFLKELEGVSDPEKKRKIIGRVFIEVFDDEAKRIENVTHLVQGTLYPDVIESVSVRGGPSVTIKTHHNVGGLPEKMKLKLIEPLREFFKDEVRAIGRALEIPAPILGRHPFPGPGLAVRVLGEISEPRLKILREADRIFREEIVAEGIYDQIWQAFAVLLPVSSVGVMGDYRTYEQTIVLRAVSSEDGMTADWVFLPHDLLKRVSSRITNEVRGVNRVVLDISSKPPATIEWE